MAYFLERSNRDYIVFERNSGAGKCFFMNTSFFSLFVSVVKNMTHSTI